jgi:predicted helicase
LYDTYIKAFRWASDRLDKGNGGIIAFITNSGWLEKGASDGIRKCLQEEFSSIYVLNLRGAIRGKSGEAAKREGQNVFDIMTGVAITLLVKTKNTKEKADIYYRDIGPYLSRKDKFSFLINMKNIFNVSDEMIQVRPDKHNDWLSLRNDTFSSFIPIGDKEDKSGNAYFIPYYSNGIKTARDHFCWNYSENNLEKNVKAIISFYNQQCKEYHKLKETKDKLSVENFIDYDSTKITWNRGFKQDIERGTIFKFNKENIYVGFHRPFCRQYLYFSKELNDMTYQMPKLFPKIGIKNYLICVSGLNTRLDNTSVLITDCITDLNILDSGTQCFPLYWYEKKQHAQGSLFEKVEDEYIRHDAVSDFILDQAHTRYGLKVAKEDIFYYVYGLLHSPGYRETFANDLKKMLPRLPLVEKPADFWAFSEAGRKLAGLHLNYEEQKKPPEVTVTGLEHKNFTVTKMSFPAKGKTSTINYNACITIANIPEKAYRYIVNGKSAIEWIMERYAVTTHKESGITNDPNDWAIEHGNPRYILDLLLSVITVSVKTADIIDSLPKLEF